MEDWLLMLFIGLICGTAGGAFFNWLARGRDSYRIDSLEDRFNRKMADGKSMAGVEAKEEQAERLQEAMAEVGAIIQQGLPDAERNKALLALVPKYPDIAAKYGAKLFKQLKNQQ